MVKRDLIVLLADLDAENAVKTLINNRRESLQIRSVTFDTVRHSMRDSGCCREADTLLRSHLRTHAHAMVIFDHHGSGKDFQSANEIEHEIEQRLVRNGWKKAQITCIVIEPELDIWVWADSVHVADVLGFGQDLVALKRHLAKEGLLRPGETKPLDPKAAVENCLRNARKPRSARLYGILAERVSLSSCVDSSFEKFTTTLKRWFPTSEA